MESADLELILLGLLVGATVLVVLAYAIAVPYPILLVLGGLALSVVPGLPTVELAPELVLLMFLPPLLYAAAFFSSLRELRANLRPIALLSTGLVLATTVCVAVVAHAVIGMPWAAAFVLGAIVSPTDPVAATAIAGRLGAPRRVVTVVEGESLINDGTALVAYRFAVTAVTAGTFSLWEAGLDFLLSVSGGALIGLALGWLIRQVRTRIEDAPTEIFISLGTAYFAYLPAELLHVSGVIAARWRSRRRWRCRWRRTPASLPLPRPDHLPRVRRDRLHPAAAGADPAAADARLLRDPDRGIDAAVRGALHRGGTHGHDQTRGPDVVQRLLACRRSRSSTVPRSTCRSST